MKFSEKTYKCRNCGQIFYNEGSLYTHKRVCSSKSKNNNSYKKKTYNDEKCSCIII